MWELIGKIGIGAVFGFIVTQFISPFYKGYIANKFDNNKNEKNHNLQLERELLYKELEFEKIKLERVLPELEKINKLMYQHRMTFNTHLYWVINKVGDTKEIETKRVEMDDQLIETIAKISIYIPKEMRALLVTYRVLVSCSWGNPKTLYTIFSETGQIEDIVRGAHDIYDDITSAFYEMTKNFLGLLNSNIDYKEILKESELKIECNYINSLRKKPSHLVAWNWLILHEYCSSHEKTIVLERLKAEITTFTTNDAVGV